MNALNEEKLMILLMQLITCWHWNGITRNLPCIRIIFDYVRFAIECGKEIKPEEINKYLENQEELCPLSMQEVKEGQEIINAVYKELKNNPWVWVDVPGKILDINKKQQVQREKIKKQKQEEEKVKHKEEKAKHKEAFKKSIQPVLKNDFLSADDFFESSSWRGIFSDQEFQETKAHFVQEWAKDNLKDLLNNKQLDEQQAAAVGAVNGNILVVARAGSGKTTTLTSRAVFLQKHCGISPHQLLLLAFNKSAAKEMEKRLASILGKDIPYVMTFHALAHALVHPEEEILYDDEKKGWLQLSNLVQEIIRDQMREQRFLNMIKEVMLSHFQDDWGQIVKGGFHLPVPELIPHRSSLPRETLAGDFVESLGEKIIANTLFKNDIEYKYGRKIYGNRETSEKKYFSIYQGKAKAIIYFFDLAGDDGFGELLEQENANRKIEIQSLEKRGWSVFDFSSSDIIPDGCEEFSRKVLERMKEKGIKVKALNDEEIWQKISVRALDSFTKAMTSFVQRCRKLNFSPEDLELKISEHETISGAERVFLEIGKITFSNYLEELGNRNKQDFDGLMWEAIELLKKGESCFSRKGGRETGDLKNLRFVLVDEFQDFSEPFYALLNEMRNFNESASFFCVGDDWQAINGFAGSDLKFYENFEEFFSCPKKLDISTNYRSAEKIVQLGNTLMQEKKPPARASTTEPGRVRVAYLSDFHPTTIESNLHKEKKFIPSVLRLVDSFIKEKKEVVLLSRENNVRGFFCSKENSKKNQSPLNLFLNC